MANLLNQIVKNPCKNPWKSWFKKCVHFSAKNFFFQKAVYKPTFSSTFTNHSTIFPTLILPLFFINLFHYSTKLTITTIKLNNIKGAF